MKINDRGMWENPTAVGHVFCDELCTSIASVMHMEECETIADFGCGTGDYTKRWVGEGFDVDAFDGNPHTPKLTRGVGRVLDLSRDFNTGRIYDAVISLEVGEHIPDKYEERFIDNLTTHCGHIIILSWAIPGQGGNGHVNCQPNDYIEWRMDERGLERDLKIENILRESVANANAHWFRNTVMVFTR